MTCLFILIEFRDHMFNCLNRVMQANYNKTNNI